LRTTIREAAEIIVEGLVQGVGYRDFTRRQAVDLGLTGWVMNLSDGRVRVRAEGPRPDIETLIAHLGTGPRLARVNRVGVTWVEPSGHGSTFTIRSENPAR
jgi:acylphosphatase